MFQSLAFILILLTLLPLQAESSLKSFNLPERLEKEAQSILEIKKKAQVDFLNSVKVLASQAKPRFVLEFPFYYVNTKLKNSRWSSLPKSQIYFLALKEAKRQISKVLFQLLLGKIKAKKIEKRLLSLVEQKAKYYIFSEKVFNFKVHPEFSFISTAKVRLKISFFNLKKLLDKEGLLYSVRKQFSILPMLNLLNTRTGYVQNWWQVSDKSLFLQATGVGSGLGLKDKNQSLGEALHSQTLPKASGLDQLLFELKSEFLNNFAKQAKPLSLYLFKPRKFKFQSFFSNTLLKESAFYPVKLASYLGPDLILNGELFYALDEQKQILKITLVLKIFKLSSKKTVVVLNRTKQWSLDPNSSMGLSEKNRMQITSFLNMAGKNILKELVTMKNKALLQAYEVVLVIKGSLAPVDLYQFISVFKFHVREVLGLHLQTLSRSEFHLKLVSTLKPKEILTKLNALVLPNYEIKGASLFVNNSRISFFLRKLKNR